jgi:hypothetical protein
MRRDEEINWPILKAGIEATLAEYQQRGGSLTDSERKQLARALADKDRSAVREALAAHVLLEVWINPESRVKVARGKAVAELTVEKARVFLVEVANDAGATSEMRIRVASGADTPGLFVAELIRTRTVPDRLGGAALQYLLVTVRCREVGRREAVFTLDAGQGTQDLGFRSEVPVLFRITQESKP